MEEERVSQPYKYKILLMDDDEFIRVAYASLLEEIGYIVVTSEDGNQAIVKYKEALKNNNPFDVVILDLTVPRGMGGIETTRHIFSLESNAKIIISSGITEDDTIINWQDYGFKGVIEKPFKIEELDTLLQKIMNNS